MLMKKNDALFLVLCTWNARPATVTVRLDTAALGLEPGTAVNPENPDERLEFDGKTLKIGMAGYGVSLVRFGKVATP